MLANDLKNTEQNFVMWPERMKLNLVYPVFLKETQSYMSIVERTTPYSLLCVRQPRLTGRPDEVTAT